MVLEILLGNNISTLVLFQSCSCPSVLSRTLCEASLWFISQCPPKPQRAQVGLQEVIGSWSVTLTEDWPTKFTVECDTLG